MRPRHCARCDSDTEADLVRHYEDGAPNQCSTCGLELDPPSAEWLAINGYELDQDEDDEDD